MSRDGNATKFTVIFPEHELRAFDRAFNMSEPRLPRGGSHGGEWTHDGSFTPVADRTGNSTKPTTNPAYIDRFFDRFVPLVRPMAQKLYIDENFLLALAVKNMDGTTFIMMHCMICLGLPMEEDRTFNSVATRKLVIRG